jgi:hypothetical protein
MEKLTLLKETLKEVLYKNLFEFKHLLGDILKSGLSTLPFETTFTPPNQVSFFDDESKETKAVTFEIQSIQRHISSEERENGYVMYEVHPIIKELTRQKNHIYSEAEVLNLIKTITTQDPFEILEKYDIEESNKMLDLEIYNQKVPILTHSILLGGKEIASITITYLKDFPYKKDWLMKKYFGVQEYSKTSHYFSEREDYDCYFTIKDASFFTEKEDTFKLVESKITDVIGEEVKCVTIQGASENCKDTIELYTKNGFKAYYFKNNIVFLIEKNTLSGHQLGQKINHNIKNRKTF